MHTMSWLWLEEKKNEQGKTILYNNNKPMLDSSLVTNIKVVKKLSDTTKRVWLQYKDNKNNLYVQSWTTVMAVAPRGHCNHMACVWSF